MSAWLATHVVDVLTGTDVDQFGDPTDGTTVAAANVAVSILERSVRAYRHDSQTPRQIPSLAGRAPAGTPVKQGDRLRDVTSGQLWVVDRVTTPSHPVMPVGMTMDLRALA